MPNECKFMMALMSCTDQTRINSMGNVWQPESWCPPKVGIISLKRKESGLGGDEVGETGAVDMAEDMADAGVVGSLPD